MSSKFNLLYQAILEDEIFKASTPEEGKRRRQEYVKIMMDEMVEQGHARKNPDGSYIAYRSIWLDCMDFTELPVKFDRVDGSFFITHNSHLTTLAGSPKTVHQTFDCKDCHLTSLEGGPELVEIHFNCSWNYLTSLDGCPKFVGRDFICNSNSVADKFVDFTEAEIRKRCQVLGSVII